MCKAEVDDLSILNSCRRYRHGEIEEMINSLKLKERVATVRKLDKSFQEEVAIVFDKAARRFGRKECEGFAAWHPLFFSTPPAGLERWDLSGEFSAISLLEKFETKNQIKPTVPVLRN